jgi:hypothetical protein
MSTVKLTPKAKIRGKSIIKTSHHGPCHYYKINKLSSNSSTVGTINRGTPEKNRFTASGNSTRDQSLRRVKGRSLLFFFEKQGRSLLNHLRVDAGRGVRLQVARHGVERDVEEVHRVTLALLRLAEPNHPPGSSETSQQTVSGKENRASEEGGGRASSLPTWW